MLQVLMNNWYCELLTGIALKHLFQCLMQNANSRFDDEKTNNAGMGQEIREFQTKISGLTSRNVELEAANSSLQKRMADLLKEMEDKEAVFRNEMARKV